MTRTALALFALVALVGCGNAAGRVVHTPLTVRERSFHSASQTYSVRQAERAFADQGVELRNVTSHGWRRFWSALDGRPRHQVYVFVIHKTCKCLYKLPIHDARKTHHGNIVVAWRPAERSTVRAALRELR